MTRKGLLRIGEAARRVGVSVDTLRRWDRGGRLKTVRGPNNARLVAESEVDRLIRRRRPGRKPVRAISARNRLPGLITELRVSGLLAQVTLDVDGHQVVAVITRDAVEDLGLGVGVRAVALIKASHVIIERSAE